MKKSLSSYGSIAALAAALSPAAAMAQSLPGASSLAPVVVTASRLFTQTPDQVTSALSVITAGDIERRQGRLVLDLLRDVPGVAVNRPGTVGGLTQVRLRGTEANHVLALFNGADISDPFQGEFDFGTLSSLGVERIEILRGQQSALYGSDAIGGVINVIPRQGRGALSLTADLEGGSFGTWRQGLSAGWGDERADVFGAVSYAATNGINISRFGSERDGARMAGGFLNAGLRLNDSTALRIIYRRNQNRAQTDALDFAFPARPTQGLVINTNDLTRLKENALILSAETGSSDKAWSLKALASYNDGRRTNLTADVPTFITQGERTKISVTGGFQVESGALLHRLSAGIDWKREKYQNVPTGVPGPANAKRQLENAGAVLGYDLTAGGFTATGALRHDDNDRFRNANTYRLGASYRFDATGTRLRAAYGTGIKAPTNIELFGFNPASFIGNPALKPERSEGGDIGIEQMVGDGFTLGATFFDSRLKDEIFTDSLPGFISTPRNRTTTSTQNGVELSAGGNLNEWLNLSAALTFLRAREAGLEEVRRPPVTGSVNLTARLPDDRGSATVTVRYNGRQADSEFISATPQSRVTLKSYTLVNLAGDYRVLENVTLFGRVENLAGTAYEEAFSYRAAGRAFYAGLRANF